MLTHFPPSSSSLSSHPLLPPNKHMPDNHAAHFSQLFTHDNLAEKKTSRYSFMWMKQPIFLTFCGEKTTPIPLICCFVNLGFFFPTPTFRHSATHIFPNEQRFEFFFTKKKCGTAFSHVHYKNCILQASFEHLLGRFCFLCFIHDGGFLQTSKKSLLLLFMTSPTHIYNNPPPRGEREGERRSNNSCDGI